MDAPPSAYSEGYQGEAVPRQSRLLAWLKPLVSLALILLLFSRVPIARVGEALRAARWEWFLLAALLYPGALLTHAIKWGVLLRAQGVDVPFRSLIRHTFIATFFNNFLPLGGADVVRGVGLARETVQRAEVAVSVLVDRLVGLLVFTSVGTLAALAALLMQEVRAPALIAIARAGSVLTMGLFLGLLLMLSGRVRLFTEHVLARLPLGQRVVPLVHRLSHAVSSYRRRPRALVWAYVVGLGTILLSNIVHWLLFAAVGVEVSFLHVSVFNPILGLLMIVPISIGGLGVNQSVIPWLYALVGVATVPAIAMSILLQIVIILTSLPGGLLWAIRRQRAPELAERADAHPL